MLLGAVVFACWALPALRGRGPYGRGLFKVVSIHVGIFAALAWPASLAVVLAPERCRRPLGLRLMAVLLALLVAVPLGDLALTLWSVRVGHFWYHSQSFARGENTPDPELIWKRRPGLSWRGRKTPFCDEVAYRTDENGFRNPPGVGRADIVFLGDSVTEAGELDEDSTFVRKTATALGLEAVNLGTSGYGPQQELVVLRRYGLAYRPRLVVWQVTEWNDVIDAQAYRMRDEPAARALPPWDGLYARHSPVMRLVSAVLPDRMPSTVEFRGSDGRVEPQMFWPYRPDLHRQMPEAFDETRRAIRSAFETCRAQGVDFVVLYVPSHVRVLLPYLRFKSESQRDRFCPGGAVDSDGDLAHAIREFCGGIGCPMIDMGPPLRDRAAVDNRRVRPQRSPPGGRRARRGPEGPRPIRGVAGDPIAVGQAVDRGGVEGIGESVSVLSCGEIGVGPLEVHLELACAAACRRRRSTPGSRPRMTSAGVCRVVLAKTSAIWIEAGLIR